MSNTVFLAGATGYIGSNFVRQFSDELTIAPIVRRDPVGFPASMWILRFADLASLNIPFAVAQQSVMIHLVGCGREKKLNAIYEGNVITTAYLVQACKRFGIGRIIYISGYGVERPSSSVYYKSRAAAETIIVESGLPYTILRCSYIVGRRDELTPRIIDSARKGKVTIPGDGNYRIQPVLVDDILSILYHLVADEIDRTGIHNILGESVSLKKFVTDIAHQINPACEIAFTDLAVLMREAVFNESPEYSLSELGIIVADEVGEPTKQFARVTITPYLDIINNILKGAVY